MKAFSAPADRNKGPILEVLKEYIHGKGRLLEIGSGTGQHAVHFAKALKDVHWITSDLWDNHKNIKEWLQEVRLKNLHGPELLEIGKDDFPKGAFDYVFTANTLHIMSWKQNKTLFKLLGKRLREGSLTFIYGPFNFGGEFSSSSNKEFDQRLKNRDSNSGIRNFDDILKIMNKAGFKLLKDHKMPANNSLLVFERLAFSGIKEKESHE